MAQMSDRGAHRGAERLERGKQLMTQVGTLQPEVPNRDQSLLERQFKPGCGQQRTPGLLSLTGGSNVTQLAERKGFEPLMPLRTYYLSKVAH